MDASIVVAIIGGAATIIAAAIAIAPKIVRARPADSSAAEVRLRTLPSIGLRTVYYLEQQHRFLNFGGKNCRIEPMTGGPSFKAPTHEIFHDKEQTRRITRESIVVSS
jgi:hypothetical protein